MNQREMMGDLLCIMIRRMHQRMGRVWLPKRRRRMNNNLQIMAQAVGILRREITNRADLLAVIEYFQAPRSEFSYNLDLERISDWENAGFPLESACLTPEEVKITDLMLEKIDLCKNLLKQRPKNYKLMIWKNLNGLNYLAKVFRSPKGQTTVVKMSNLPPLTPEEAIKEAAFWFDFAAKTE